MQNATNHRAQPPSLFDERGSYLSAVVWRRQLPLIVLRASLGGLERGWLGRGSRVSVIRQWIVDRVSSFEQSRVSAKRGCEGHLAYSPRRHGGHGGEMGRKATELFWSFPGALRSAAKANSIGQSAPGLAQTKGEPEAPGFHLSSPQLAQCITFLSTSKIKPDTGTSLARGT